MEHDFKTITYRGGIVTFRVPSHWREEYEPEGGGTFYDDAPDSGTFRLNIVTAKAPFPITSESGPQVLASFRETSEGIERLDNDCAILSYSLQAEEDGHPLNITYWLVAQPIPPSSARIATFTYTVRADQLNDARCREELEMLDREIRAAQFAPRLANAP